MQALGSALGEHFLALRAFLYFQSPSQANLPSPQHPRLLCSGQQEKTLGLAPCLSGVQHFQGACLVSSIARCFSSLCSRALARISWLWVRSNAGLCARLCFICSCPIPAWVTVSGLSASTACLAEPAEEALCEAVLERGRAMPLSSSSALCPAFTPAQPRVKGGTGFQEYASCLLGIAKSRLPTLNSPGS